MDNLDPLVVIANPNNPQQKQVLYETDPTKLETQLRKITINYGGFAGIALWAFSGKELKSSSLPISDPFYNTFLLGEYVFKA
jgi:hypothetical protein